MSFSDPNTSTAQEATTETVDALTSQPATTTTTTRPKVEETAPSPTTTMTSLDQEVDDKNKNQGTVKNDNDNNNGTFVFEQWVDYLPHDVVNKDNTADKRSSLDVTSSHLTDSQADEECWPDTASLEEDGLMMVPNVLLIEHDVRLQHELLLDDPQFGGSGGASAWKLPSPSSLSSSPPPPIQTVGSSSGASTCSASTTTTTTTTTASLPTQRRLLWATMQASQQTRRYLEPHIRQRASLARVLQSIEHSSVSLQRHVCSLLEEEENEDGCDNDDVMDICDDEKDQEMLASALSGLADDDAVVDHDDDDDDIVVDEDEPMSMLTSVAEDDLPEPPELTIEDIEATDFSALVQNETDNDDAHLEFYDPMI